MAVEQRSTQTSTRMVVEEDEQWIRGIFELIPRGVYQGGGDLKPSNANKRNKDISEEVTKSNRAEPNKRKRRSKKVREKNNASERSEDPARAELERKLREKIASIRAERKAEDGNTEAVPSNRKRKREKRKEVKGTPRNFVKNERSKKAQATVIKENSEELNGSSELQLETTRVAGLGDDGQTRKRRKLRGSKLKELQKNLDEATKERELKEKAIAGVHESPINTPIPNQGENQKTGNGKGSKESASIANVVQEREMEKALMRVKGERVKDDVTKIRKSIRRVKRKSAKSQEEWAARVKSVNKDIKKRQEKRTKNLTERKEAKKSGTKSKKKSSRKSKGKKA